jgi:hypothetical protein
MAKKNRTHIHEAYMVLHNKFFDEFVIEYGNDMADIIPKQFAAWLDGRVKSQNLIEKYLSAAYKPEHKGTV